MALVSLTRSALADSVTANVATRAADLADLATAGSVPQPIPFRDAISAQIVDESGEVLASTSDIDGQAPIATRRSGEAEIFTVPTLDGSSEEEERGKGEGPYAVAMSTAATSEGRVWAVAAASLGSAEDAADALVRPLGAGVPLLVALVAVTTWILVGRSLRPVRAMTEEAGRITASRLDRRIPVPGAGDEIAQLAETLNTMLDRLDSSMTRQRRFVADASHEFKSPVASLLTMAEVAADVPGGLTVGELAADVAAEARRLALLVDDLLTLARSDEGLFDLRSGVVDLSEVAAEQVAAVPHPRVRIDTSGVTPVTVSGDRRRLAQAVRNLLDNAIRYATHAVWMETGERDGLGFVLVADDGPGIAEENRARVFERFVRADDARGREEGGTGLGLSVVHAIVEGHGGHVEVVDDDRFPGAVFLVALPRNR